MTNFKKTISFIICLCSILSMTLIPMNADEIDNTDNVIGIEIRNIPTDTKIPTEVTEIVQYLFSIKRRALTDAFSLDNSKNTLLAQKNSLKSKINDRILEREDERIYEIQRYYVLSGGTDYYASCNLEYYCTFRDQYTDSGKLYVVISERVIFTEADGTIATSDSTKHTLEFIVDNNSYFLNNDAYTDIDFTCSMVDENGVVTKNLQYPEVDLKAIVSDPNYNKPDNSKSRSNVDSIRALATYRPALAVSYALTYCTTPNYQNYRYITDGGDCANFVSQCLAAGNLTQKNASSAYPWYYNKSSTVCTCTSFNPNHTCRNNDTYAHDWSFTSLKDNIVNNSYGVALYAQAQGTYSCSDMSSGDLLSVRVNGQDNAHIYICVGYDSSIGKLKFADHNFENGEYGDVKPKDIYYMSNFYIIDMYVRAE